MNFRVTLFLQFVTASIIFNLSEAVFFVPSDACQYTSDLLYSTNVETSFTGEIFPVAIDPSSQHLSKFNPLTRCYIPVQTEKKSRSLGGGLASIRQLSKPTSLKLSEEYLLCLFGCLRFLYRVSTFKADFESEESNIFFVLIISKRQTASCPYVKNSTFVSSSFSGKQYYSAHQRDLQNSFNDKREPSGTAMGLYAKTRNERMRHKKYFIDKCIPNERDKRDTNVKNSFIRATEEDKDSIDFNQHMAKRSLCRNIYNSLANRLHIAKRRNPLLTDYDEIVKIVEPKRVLFVPKRLSLNPSEISYLPQITSTCYIDSSSRSIHVVPTESSIKLICRFGCERQYLKYIPTGDVVRFLHKPRCYSPAFAPCCGDASQPSLFGCRNIFGRGFRTFSNVNTALRKPISAIFHVTDPKDDRRNAVRMAIKRLRSREGFASIPRSKIGTKTIRKGKFKYKVILMFDLILLEY